MRATKTLASVAALAAGLAISSAASAATIVISDQYDGGAITFQGSGTNSAAAFFTEGSLVVNLVTGFSLLNPLLNTTANTGIGAPGDSLSHTLNLFVTAEGLTNPLGVMNFLTGFTTNDLPVGWTLTSSSFLDTGNHAPGDGGYSPTALSTTTFAPNPLTQAVNGNATADTGAGPYSVVAEYSYTFAPNTSGVVTSTISVAAIPEPATWGMMILGFGGIGAMVRSSRRRQAVATA